MTAAGVEPARASLGGSPPCPSVRSGCCSGRRDRTSIAGSKGPRPAIRRSRIGSAQGGSRTRTATKGPRCLKPGCLPFQHLSMWGRPGFEPGISRWKGDNHSSSARARTRDEERRQRAPVTPRPHEIATDPRQWRVAGCRGIEPRSKDLESSLLPKLSPCEPDERMSTWARTDCSVSGLPARAACRVDNPDAPARPSACRRGTTGGIRTLDCRFRRPASRSASRWRE